MDTMSLPNGGFIKYSSVFGQVIPTPKCACQKGACGMMPILKDYGFTPDPNLHYFIEANKQLGVTTRKAIPERYANVLNGYKTAIGKAKATKEAQNTQLKQIAPYNPEFAFYRVIGLHGDVPNNNGDLFRWGALEDKESPELLRFDNKLGKYVYQTFIGKGNYKDHQNDQVIKAVGILLDSVPNHKVKGVELLIAVDKEKDPMLVRGIDQGYICDVSMGARVAYSICSVCDNVAHNSYEYCIHIKNWKGAHYSGPETNWMPKLAYEDNRGVEFIEESWVTVGADPSAKYLEKIAHLNHAKNKMLMDDYIHKIYAELEKQEPNYHKMNNLLNFAIAQAVLIEK